MKQLCLLFWAILCPLILSAQSDTGTITGLVQLPDGTPATSTHVWIRGTQAGAVTDAEGRYTIGQVPAGERVLVASRIGSGRVRQSMLVVAGQTITIPAVTLTESAETLDEVTVAGKPSYKTDVVSGSLRLKTPLLELPQNVQVISRQLLADQQVFDMLEGVSRNVSGVTKQEHWDNYARLNMRGSRIAPFRNGMNVQSTWGPLAEDMSMVDRIEFVKGPAGFMMANGEPSGFYNIVTKKPTGVNRGEVTLTTGSFDTYRAALDLDGRLSADGKLLYRFNVMGQAKGSYRDFEYNNRVTLAPVLTYKLSEQTSLTAEYTYQYSQMSAIGSAYVFSRNGFGELPRNATTASANLDPTRIHDHSAFLILNHRLDPNWQLTGQLAYFSYTQVGSSLWADSLNTRGDLYRRLSSWDAANQGKFAQVFVNGDVTTGPVQHRLLLGLDLGTKEYMADWNQTFALYNDSYTFNIYRPTYYLPADLLPKIDRSTSLRYRAGVNVLSQSYSGVYLQDELWFWRDHVRLTLAGRITSARDSEYGAGTAETVFTPRVGISGSLSRQTSIYALYDQAFVPQAGATAQGIAFKPVTGDNVEAGIKKDWANGRWNATASVYRITKNNVLTSDPTNPTYSIQLGQTQTRGVEFDLRGTLLPGLNVVANYALTDSKITRDTQAENVGQPVPGFARHITNAWLAYRLQTGALKGLGVSFGYQWQLDRYGWYVDTQSREPVLPNYFRTDGAVSWQHDKLSLALNVNNLLNAYLYSGSPYPYGGYNYYQIEAPRNYRLSLGYRF
ncbi:TonB-dependent siderophore receptor [Spirosoma luteolum]